MRNSSYVVMLAGSLLIVVCATLPREARAEPQNSQIEQEQSVVNAARYSRELKKKAAPPARVITNDDLDSARAKSVQGSPAPGIPPARQTEAANTGALVATETPKQAATLMRFDSGSESNESEEAAAEDAEIAKLKDQLASAENSLFWQKRALLLDQNTVYSNATYTTTLDGQTELDTAQLKIDQKQREVYNLKGPLADLEWRRWRRLQASSPENGSAGESYKSVPPSALVLPQP
ncbi:MAG TPA: hypothetical protein VLK33_20140 [Terriglobales bacterium]|nr:hypothetical protein [Terriglobales bacterium]